ncbi:MAG TPA: aminotransferase class I/II-fold pyridoxal phosphate-dependent enzyme, partial [Ramlibacter sp.]
MTAAPQLPERLARLIRHDVQGMHAYAVQPSAGLVKLDAMENPHRLPPSLQRELGERLGAVAINRYPGDRVDTLRQALARHAQVPEGFSLMLGNGSDEVLAHVFMALLRHPAPLLFPDVSYSFYPVYAKLYGIAAREIPLAD